MGLLYLDSSSFLTAVLTQEGHAAISALLSTRQDAGDRLVSSRLLPLEAARVTIRERLLGNDIEAEIDRHLQGLDLLPVTEEVWQRAGRIEQHLRALDAIHLATCELVGATLLAAGLDSGIRRAAQARGIPQV